MEQHARALHLASSLPERTGDGDARYRQLVEQVPAVTYVAEFSADAPFTFVSPQMEDLLGFPVERWLAEPELWSDRLHPEDRERVLQA